MTAPNFSKAPRDVLTDALSKGYVSLHVEQGVPVLDRDLNLLGDLISSALQQIVSRHIGDGVAGTADFAVVANGDPLDFTITAGSFLAAGRLVALPADTTYGAQIDPATGAKVQKLTAAAGARIDTAYLDVWTDEVDDKVDHDLGNGLDIGLRTSTRTRSLFVVRVAENAAAPPAAVPPGHAFVPLARLDRGAGSIADLRMTRMSIAQVSQRMATIESVLAPAIDSVAPNLVQPAQTNPMVVSGRNLNLGGVTVTLGGVPAAVDPASTATSLIVAVPAAAVPGKQTLVVKTLIGSEEAPLKVTVQAPPPPPAFAADPTAIVPSHATVGAQLTLNGSHFTGVNRVTFNAAVPAAAVLPGDIASVSDVAIVVNVPAALSAAAGSTMTLTASIDGRPAMTGTSATLFTVDPQPIPAPKYVPSGQITTDPPVNPVTQSRGKQVILRGTNFGTPATTTVRFFGTGSSPVTALPTDIVSVEPTKIVVKVPAALTVPPVPGNQCKISVEVQGLRDISSEVLLVI